MYLSRLDACDVAVSLLPLQFRLTLYFYNVSIIALRDAVDADMCKIVHLFPLLFLEIRRTVHSHNENELIG